jgi:hypothetical protein
MAVLVSKLESFNRIIVSQNWLFLILDRKSQPNRSRHWN